MFFSSDVHTNRNIEGPAKHRSSRGKALLLIAFTVIGGLAAGLLLNLALQAIPTAKDKPVAQLIRDLKKQDSALDKGCQELWLILPRAVTTRFPGLEPKNAASIRREAAGELKFRGAGARAAIPALIASLNDPETEVRVNAIQALDNLGPAAEFALPDLIRCVKDPNAKAVPGFQPGCEALLALASIAPRDVRVIPLLNDYLGFKRSSADITLKASMRAYALEGLVRIAKVTNSVAPMLIAALRESGFNLVRPAVFELPVPAQSSLLDAGEPRFAPPIPFGTNPRSPLAPAEAEGLQRAQAERQEYEARVGFSASLIDALGRIGPQTPEVVPTLIAALKSREYPILSSGVDALGNIGAAGASAVPTLIELLERSRQTNVVPNMPDRYATADIDPVLVRRYGLVDPALPPVPDMRRRIILTLGKVGPTARAALPTLIEEYRDNRNPFRFDAAMARWRIDGQAQEVRAVLAGGLKEPKPHIRRNIIGLLGELGVEAVPELIEGLNNDDAQVRIYAMESLAALGVAARSAAPLIEQALTDRKYIVRTAAEKALKKIRTELPARTEAAPAHAQPPRKAP